MEKITYIIKFIIKEHGLKYDIFPMSPCQFVAYYLPGVFLTFWPYILEYNLFYTWVPKATKPKWDELFFCGHSVLIVQLDVQQSSSIMA